LLSRFAFAWPWFESAGRCLGFELPFTVGPTYKLSFFSAH
jgi:hypothetical protein